MLLFHKVGNDVIQHVIFQYIPFSDILRLRSVNKFFQQLVQEYTFPEVVIDSDGKLKSMQHKHIIKAKKYILKELSVRSTAPNSITHLLYPFAMDATNVTFIRNVSLPVWLFFPKPENVKIIGALPACFATVSFNPATIKTLSLETEITHWVLSCIVQASECLENLSIFPTTYNRDIHETVKLTQTLRTLTVSWNVFKLHDIALSLFHKRHDKLIIEMSNSQNTEYVFGVGQYFWRFVDLFPDRLEINISSVCHYTQEILQMVARRERKFKEIVIKLEKKKIIQMSSFFLKHWFNALIPIPGCAMKVVASFNCYDIYALSEVTDHINTLKHLNLVEVRFNVGVYLRIPTTKKKMEEDIIHQYFKYKKLSGSHRTNVKIHIGLKCPSAKKDMMRRVKATIQKMEKNSQVQSSEEKNICLIGFE